MLELCMEKPLSVVMFGRFRQTNGWDHGGRTLGEHLAIVGTEGNAVFNLAEKIMMSSAA